MLLIFLITTIKKSQNCMFIVQKCMNHDLLVNASLFFCKYPSSYAITISHLWIMAALLLNLMFLSYGTLTSQINVVLRLVFLRFCVSLRSLIQGTTFSFLPLLHNPSFILIMRRDTHILLLLFSVLHGHILYQSICKKGRRIRFWHSNWHRVNIF